MSSTDRKDDLGNMDNQGKQENAGNMDGQDNNDSNSNNGDNSNNGSNGDNNSNNDRQECESAVIDTELLSGFIDNSLQDVLGTMAGFALMKMELSEKEKRTYSAEITGAMLLRGGKDAMLSISMDKSASEIIVAYMTGIMPDEMDEEDLYDGVSELVNLIAGRLKAQLSGHILHFELSPPFTIVGDNHFIIHKNLVTKISHKYGRGEIELFAELFYIN